MKVCVGCGETKSLAEFYAKPSTPYKYAGRCDPCRRAGANAHYKANKDRYREARHAYASRTRERQKELTREYSNSIHGRAKILLKSAQKRAKTKDRDVTIDLDFIKSRLNTGVCEVTGLVFDFSPPIGQKNNPFAPSLDRIDSTGGYTPENSRIVLWQYNAMKMTMSDDEVLMFFKLFVECIER